MRRAAVLYIMRRLMAIGLMMLIISFAVFALLYAAPGDPIQILLGPAPRSPEVVQALEERYHLNEPLLTQYWIWLKGALRLDFGNSIQTSTPVIETIKQRFPVSLFLGIYAYIVTMAVGLALGVWAALRKQRVIDRVVVGGSVVGLSSPTFVTGVVLLYLFAVILPWFPVFGRGEGFLDGVWHLTLPAIAMALTSIAYIVKHTRAAVINAVDQDYMLFARARGLSSKRILVGYALRNALIPIVTIAAPLLAFMLTGAVFAEVVFSLPGMGELLVRSATTKDLPMLQGVALISASLILGANLIADLIYMVVDPRVRLWRVS